MECIQRTSGRLLGEIGEVNPNSPRRSPIPLAASIVASTVTVLFYSEVPASPTALRVTAAAVLLTTAGVVNELVRRARERAASRNRPVLRAVGIRVVKLDADGRPTGEVLHTRGVVSIDLGAPDLPDSPACPCGRLRCPHSGTGGS